MSNDAVLEDTRMELKQLEHLKEVSGEFVKVIKGINTRFESILDGTKFVVGVSNRWNDVFRLVGANGAALGEDGGGGDVVPEYLVIESMDEDK